MLFWKRLGKKKIFRLLPRDCHDRVLSNAKATILAIAGKIDHLHIICTKQFFYKDTGAQSVLAVNVSSIREKGTYDGTCVLRAGDHPFITHDSYIRYKDAVVMRVEKLISAVNSGEITVMENVSDEVFGRILAGFEKSEYTKTNIKKLLRKLSQE